MLGNLLLVQSQAMKFDITNLAWLGVFIFVFLRGLMAFGLLKSNGKDKEPITYDDKLLMSHVHDILVTTRSIEKDARSLYDMHNVKDPDGVYAWYTHYANIKYKLEALEKNQAIILNQLSKLLNEK